jgi:hypothetical protein
MSCVLRVRGANFNVDEFLAKSTLQPLIVARRGQAQYPNGPVPDTSGFHVAVSDANFSQLQVQIEDAIRFLERNQNELARLAASPGIEKLSLDFGIEERSVAAQTERFPPNLLRAVGALGIWLEFTLYPRHDSSVAGSD